MQSPIEIKAPRRDDKRRIRRDARTLSEVKKALALRDVSEMDNIDLSRYVRCLANKALIIRDNLTDKEAKVYNAHFRRAVTILNDRTE